MKFDDVYISGTAVRVPGRLSAATAVADGLCEPKALAGLDLESVAVSERESAPDMAVKAARSALARSGAGPEDIDLILHATLYYQGHDLWAPASYIQRRAVGNRCPAIEVRQVSNGGMAALELAARSLSGGPAGGGALITTGDRFCAPGFDRWRSDPGTVYGDAGTALVLSRRGGFARLRSLATVSEPDLEGMHRGDDPFGDAPFSVRRPMDLDVQKRAFVKEVGVSYSVARVAAGQNEALKQALTDAGAELTDIDWFVLPHFGLRRLTQSYLRPWGIDADRTTWSSGRTVGHLGGGDQISGLTDLVERGRLRPGQRCLLAGVGAGFTFSCAVVEIEDCPDWAR